MIVKACDHCHKLNTEVGELLKVQEPKIGTKYSLDTDQTFGEMKYTGVFVFGNLNRHEVPHPYRELCRECTKRVAADVITELE